MCDHKKLSYLVTLMSFKIGFCVLHKVWNDMRWSKWWNFQFWMKCPFNIFTFETRYKLNKWLRCHVFQDKTTVCVEPTRVTAGRNLETSLVKLRFHAPRRTSTASATKHDSVTKTGGFPPLCLVAPPSRRSYKTIRHFFLPVVGSRTRQRK